MSEPDRKLKAGQWIDDRYYVADVCGGNCMVLARQIGETREQVIQRGKLVQLARKRQEAANKARRPRRRS